MAKGYPEDWNSRRREIYRRDNYTCQNCKARGGRHGDTELHAHHIVPKSKGGTHKKRNLVTMCKACHDAIHGRGQAPIPIDEGSLSERIRAAIERHYRTDEHDDGYVRLGKSSSDRGYFQRKSDKERNQQYGGCPRCCERSLTVSWVGLQPMSKVKIVECTSCSAQYDESIEKEDGDVHRRLREIDDPSKLDSTSSAVLKELKDQLRLRFGL